MPLRPISLAIQSSTKIKILFSEELSTSIDNTNVSIESISSSQKLNIKEVSVDGRILNITSEPQSEGEYYQIVLKSTETSSFKSEKGHELINDSTSRKIFFVGSENYNPVRDRMILNAPSNYNLQSGLIRDFLGSNADEIYKAQRMSSELLSDNYIRQESVDETRTRSSGPRDRFVNEGVFKVKRVSKNVSGRSNLSKTINYSYDSMIPRHYEVSTDPVSLQEIYTQDEITSEQLSLFKKSGILSLNNKNLIKILEIVAELNGEETYYNIEEFKYSIKNNRYDSQFSYSDSTLDTNQFYTSTLSNLGDIFSYDKLTVSYLHKDKSISTQGGIEVFEAVEITQESVPYQQNSFFLKNYNICDSLGQEISFGGLSFSFIGSSSVPYEFSSEIPFDSKYPSSEGEFSVNYLTGEVRLYGTDGMGLESSGIVVSYWYKRYLQNNFDYYMVDNDIVFNKKRLVINNNPRIFFEYENIFVEDIHYRNMSHVEVLNEKVGPSLNSSFSIKAKNSPINNVFRIKNSTTGEVYNYLYSIGSRIYFSGNRSPEISDFRENLNPHEKYDKLYPSNENIYHIIKTKISSFNGNLINVPAFRSDNINTISSNYFIHSEFSNSLIKVNSIISASGFITGFILDSTSSLPPVNSEIFLSLKFVKLNLSNSNILDLSGTKLGNFANSSVSFDTKLFERERGDLNFSKPGDYFVDYKLGEIYLAPKAILDEYGGAKYRCSKYFLSRENPVVITEMGRGKVQYFDKDLYENYVVLNDVDSIDKFIYQVNNNYEINLETEYLKINGVYKYSDIENEIIAPLEYSINENVINFKDEQIVKYREDSDFYYFDIDQPELFFEIRNKEGVLIVDKDLKIFLENLYFKNIIDKSGRQDVYLVNKDITKKISKGDIIINNGNSFIITSFNKVVGTITVTPEIEGDALDSNYSIECYSKLSIDNNVIKINKKYKNLYNDIYKLYSKKESLISINENIYIDFHLLPLHSEYKYLKDQIYISYEYGDNEIEWIDQEAVLEGEDYYVTYEYGAMREKLKSNFGNLTKIPFFTKFSINTDREFYRDALEGAMQSFVKGPTLDSIQSVTKSIVKTTPDIDEHFYKNWILSRDNLCENKIVYGGNLEFAPVKFNEGMKFGNGNWVEIPLESHLSIEEGSLSCWIMNDWDGIENDAEIFFDFYSLGVNIFFLNLKESIYSSANDIEILGLSDSVGILSQNDKGVSAYNWDLDSVGKKYGNFSFGKRIDQYSAGVETLINFRKSIPFSKIDNLFLENYVDHSSVIVNDGTRVVSLDLKIENAFENTSTIFYIDDTEQDLLPIYYKDSNYIRCKCNNPEILDDYINLKQKVTKIDLFSSLNLNDFAKNLISSQIEEFCFIVDDKNDIYKIKSIGLVDGNIQSIEIFSLPINRGNVYSKPLEFKNMLVSTSFKIFFAYEEMSFINGSTYEEEFGIPYFHLIKFNTTYEYELEINAKSNTLNISLNNEKSSLYYTDLKRVNDYSEENLSLLSADDKDLVSSYYGVLFHLKGQPLDVEFNIESLRIQTQGILSKDDIYIGPSGLKPKLLKNFSLKKTDLSGMGTVNTFLYDKGLFIGLIENNTGETNLGDSMWLFRFKAPEYVRIASKIENGIESYEYVKLNYRLDGKITTDGDFSFVSPLSFSIPGYDLVDSGSRKYYKFSGFNKLEADGWNAVYSLDGEDDFSAEFYKWRKEGSFDSENSVYKIFNIEGYSYMTTYIDDSNKDISVSFSGKITLDQDFRNYSQTIVADKKVYLIGVSPIKYYDEEFYINIELGVYEDLTGVLIFKDKDGTVIDFNSVNWNNGLFNEIKIVKNNYIDIYFNDSIVNRFSKNELSSENKAGRYIEILLNRYSVSTNNIIEISGFEYLSKPKYISSFQDNDKFYANDKEIEFSLLLNEVQIDGYQDEYASEIIVDDGYLQDDIDEFIFVADKDRYIFNSEDGPNSISLYKGGNGFLNFKVTDKDGTPFVVSSNIKNFKSGEVHHIGASWSLNNDGGDSMHLFIDGDESPNLVRLGTDIPTSMFDKFSDPEKEVLQNFVVKDISFYEPFTANISARSEEVRIEAAMPRSNIGRSVIVRGASLASNIIGKAFVISEISEDGMTLFFKDLDTMNNVVFDTSSSISIVYPPSVGYEERRIFTNMKHQKFRVFIDEREVGISIYGIDESGPFEIDSDISYFVESRVYPDGNAIEFLKKKDGIWDFSVDKDSMVHVKSYGLSMVIVREKIDVSSELSEDGISLVRTNLPSPIDYRDVLITKIIEPRFIPDFEIITEGEI